MSTDTRCAKNRLLYVRLVNSDNVQLPGGMHGVRALARYEYGQTWRVWPASGNATGIQVTTENLVVGWTGDLSRAQALSTVEEDRIRFYATGEDVPDPERHRFAIPSRNDPFYPMQGVRVLASRINAASFMVWHLSGPEMSCTLDWRLLAPGWF